ncbi:hypothetical protein [Longitalea arenae]|uniref:hypothetical protein n=1 Tax=Longitalea arenae TaxID=2812558 RepID=UPI001966FA5D|nr:hypothetical protein [Longitalea arenae]
MAFISFLGLLLMKVSAFGQSEINLEQYHVVSPGQPGLYMPLMQYQHARNWYAEARYNYEDAETFSLYLGKAFTGGNALNYSFIPMFGGSLGRFKGLSTGLNIDMEYDKFFFSSQSQYSVPTDGYEQYFLYSWSELGYQGLRWLYAGVSVQHTHDRAAGNVWQPGMMMGFSFKRFTIPVYTFEPFTSNRNFIVGVTMTWKHHKKKQAYPVVKSDAAALNSTGLNKR